MSTSSTVRTVKDWKQPGNSPSPAVSLPWAHYPNFSSSPRHGVLFYPPPKRQKIAPRLVIMGEDALKDSLEKPGHQDSSPSITQLTPTPSFGEANPAALWKDMSLGFPSTCSETQSSEILAIQRERQLFLWNISLSPVPFPTPSLLGLQHHLYPPLTLSQPSLPPLRSQTHSVLRRLC